MRNTLVLAARNCCSAMPVAILLALALHETRFLFFRSLVQTVTYLPHFLSWVVMFGILAERSCRRPTPLERRIKVGRPAVTAFLTSPTGSARLSLARTSGRRRWSTFCTWRALLTVTRSCTRQRQWTGLRACGGLAHLAALPRARSVW